MNKKIDDLTELEAKRLLHEISDVFGIGSNVRMKSVILTNVKNSKRDLFCRHKKMIEFLEGKTFRFIKKASGYIFTIPGHKPDASGRTLAETIENAILFDEEDN